MLHSIGMTTPAYAHDHELEHGSHVNIIEPIRSIVVYDDHEPWWKDPPEIWLHFTVLLRPNTNDLNVDKFDLKQVNQENENYTQYKYRLRKTLVSMMKYAPGKISTVNTG